MAEVIPQITIDDSKVKETWVQNEVVTNDVYNAINKAVINLKDNNNLLDSNAMLFREEYNSSSKDLNNAIHQGVYSFTSSAVNAPSGVNGGNLLVTNTSKNEQGSSIITQIAFCHNGAVYARTKNTSENFTSWNKLAYITDNVASATKATQDGDGNTINTTYLKLSGGTMKGNIYFTGVTSGIQRIIKNTEFDSGITFTPDFMGFWDWRDNTRVLTYNYNKKELTAGVAINGVTPSTSDNSTKLATTAFVQSLLTNKFTASKQQNGWWKDGNTGMIWQWGVVKESSSSSDYKYFPISFPNSCFVVIGVINEYPVSDFFTPWAYPVDKTKFLIGVQKDYISVYNMGYIAIGY